MASHEIAIVGGGIAGLTAALELHRAGHSVTVYESVLRPAELGVGINLLPHAVRVLDELGLLDELQRNAVATTRLLFVSRDGTEIWSEPRGRAAGYPWPQLSIHRGRLQMILLERVRRAIGVDRVRTGLRLVGVEGTEPDTTRLDGSAVVATFVDRNDAGSDRNDAGGDGASAGDRLLRVEADLVIGADGLHSALRSQLYPDQGFPHPSGLVLWRGAVVAPAYLDGATMFMAGDDDQKAVVYPISPPDSAGMSLINWVAERPVEVDMATVSWNREVPVAPIAELFAGWDYGWIDIAGLIASTPTAYEFPMVDRTPVERWSFGRVTLIGDAAHPMRPNGSNGASQAILDAEAIRIALDANPDPSAALADYESARLEPTAALTFANRQAGPERVMQWVADRCGGDCVGQHRCVDTTELEREATAYKQLAQFDLATLRAMAESTE